MKRLTTYILLFISLFTARAELTVNLLTIDPGNDIYQLEGHTELRFYDPDRGIDSTVSWGVFDFNSPGFVYRFVKGDTDYMAVAYPYQVFLANYTMSERRVTSMKLNLTADEAERLLALVTENLLPQNRVYRYNYVKDNCATRPMMLIEEAIGGPLTVPDETTTTTTWRQEMERYHANYAWYQFGIDLCLGSGIDRSITRRQACYAPVTLREYMTEAQRPDGAPIMEGSEQVVLSGTIDGEPLPPTPVIISPIATSVLILMVTIIASVKARRRHTYPRIIASLLYGMAFLVGLVLTYLIFVSTHEATSPNWNYLLFNPLSFVPLVGVWLKKSNPIVYSVQIVNFALLIGLTIVVLTKGQQLNIAMFPLIASYAILSAQYISMYRCQKKSIYL